MSQTGLTKREMQIMNILWNSENPLSAHDILMVSPDLSRNTIQIVLKKLQTLGFIEVAGFGYHKNALTRTFQPVVSQSKYFMGTLAASTSLEIALRLIEETESHEILEQIEEAVALRREKLAETAA